MKLSVVIPAYNEEDNIKQALYEVATAFPYAEIIVVNDCSTDNTLRILEGMSFYNLKIINNWPNCGHGFSVIKGFKKATGDYILYIDADRQIDLSYLANIPKGDYDIVSGWRIGRHDKLFRKFISFSLKTTNLLFHRMYIKDANCPFKLYKRSSLMQLIDRVPRSYIVPIACLEVLARKQGMATLTIPTPHKPYEGIRQGFLQSFNPKMYQFLWNAFKEVVSL